MNRQNISLFFAVLMVALMAVPGGAQSEEKKEVAMKSLPELQIEVEVKFVAFTKSHIDNLMQKDSGEFVSVEALQGLIKDGKARILFAPRLITKSGANAEVKAVTECIYPTKFETAELSLPVSATNATTQCEKSIVVPTAFQTRDTGVILNVTSTLAPDFKHIDLVLLPQIVYEPVWKDYGITYIDASGRQQQVKMEQPIFSSRCITTSITVENGITVLCGGGMNIKADDKEVIYVLVTARTVNSQGKPTK